MVLHAENFAEVTTPKANKGSNWSKRHAGLAKDFSTFFGRKDSTSSTDFDESPVRPLLGSPFTSSYRGESSDDDANDSMDKDLSLCEDTEFDLPEGPIDGPENVEEFTRLQSKLLGADWIDSFSDLLDTYKSAHILLPKVTEPETSEVETTHLLKPAAEEDLVTLEDVSLKIEADIEAETGAVALRGDTMMFESSWCMWMASFLTPQRQISPPT
jgi:hypothetical protein